MNVPPTPRLRGLFHQYAFFAALAAGLTLVALADGLNRLRNAWARIRRAAPEDEHPLFGDLSHSEWIMLNLRHAELHQGFFIPIGIGERR